MIRRMPILPTLITMIGVLILCGLGRWQLERREWKHRKIAELAAAPHLPPVSPGEFSRALAREHSIQYRRAEISCHGGAKKPYDLRPGASFGGTSGYFVLFSCRPNDRPPDIVAVAGWTRRLDVRDQTVVLDSELKGIIIERPYGDEPGRPAFMLIPDQPIAPFGRPRQPVAADLPDNHLAYAGQWFGLAIALSAIYGLWLRKRGLVARAARAE